jgi:hypothetical protein
MLFFDDSNKINFNEILALGKFDMSEEELRKVSLFLAKVNVSNLGLII